MNRGLFIFILFALPVLASASVVINEVAWMGTANSAQDEWIELYSSTSQNLDGWILMTEDTGMNLNLSGTVNGYYLIERTDDTTVPNVAADLVVAFGSGLSNTGEILILKDAGGNEINRVDGSGNWAIGGNNTTKETLQRTASDWTTAAATPKAQNAGSGVTPPPSSQDEEGGAIFSGSVPPLPVNQIKAYAGLDRAGIAGGEIFFEGFAEGLKGDPLDGARFSWNFGDGTTLVDGKKISHTFLFPGVYTISLNVSAGEYSALDTVAATVSGNPLIVSELKPGSEGWVEIKNNSARKIEISRFGFGESASKPFFFSENTFLAPWALVVLSTSTLGFILPESGEVKLLYPNGKVIFSSSYPNLHLGINESLSFESGGPASPSQGGWLKTMSTPGAKNEISKISKNILKELQGQTKEISVGAVGAANGDTTIRSSEFTGPQNLTASANDAGRPRANYFWIFAGLSLGILGGLTFVIIRRHFTL